MNLTDFLNFEPFNEMRARMGTDQLGQFELFDPEVHLTGEERSRLARQGMTIERRWVGRLLDFTLSYKNSRVVLVERNRLHVAQCEQFPEDDTLAIATSLKPFEQPPRVCPACLQHLTFKGYDETKARKERYNASVLDRFSLDDFWKEYPPYPLNRDRELVKPLD
ncbi:hypothetical protein [Saccharospirillum salsuginis]|uniref:Uncharacterized protein n=1 Tax=Saccharospirillum salsuginis TaxID=418750 RepID=A0A918KI30_9GAMM|nr:hypothetical protein [Saccharospirillum salsuginis]GGX61939.1 hypothetical protein GCM10007392_32240 [Saccharospirillum salsuginis]